MKQSFADRLRGGWEDKTGFSGGRLLLWSLGFTLFWGLLAHAYGFLQDSFSHSSVLLLMLLQMQSLINLSTHIHNL